ncbi:ABC transporter substrate-binding protein [Litorilituus sediminis]|uniref:Glycine/betaine ABC transporter substrate-binding protein n=1 Tax=Litorilituus sediminis TaxID=718192 RepID=A0A4P6P6T7_9GAMM|nr:ABC transporter substrate-binding protein [Litorilituus sediminis]QBG37341.1 glycine/betaine ABC transporter substrate-binding protein [Litorilituus sediminis]
MRILAIALLTLVFSVMPASSADKIVLPLNHWASQQLLTKLVGNKIEQLGFAVDYLPIKADLQIGALRTGVIHIQVSVWQSQKDDDFSQAVKRGLVEDMGAYSAIGREDWWYPEYVQAMCPGLPHWLALKDCAALFGQGGKGVFYTGPWNYRDAELIRALKLNFTITRLASADELWQRLRQAIDNQEAIVLLNWTPSWLDVRLDGRFIEFPAFEHACLDDPTWGVNKTMIHDCGNPKKTLIKKAVWPGLKDKWPCIYQLMQYVDFTHEMIAEASALYGVEKQTEQEAMNSWLDKFAHQSAWLNFTCSS